MASVKDSFLDLERHRQLLEENIEKLRSALQHWQLWEAEYEALKEEVETLPQPANREDLARIRRDFDGQLLTQKEVREIFGDSDLKPAAQIVNVVSRRIDYVSKNIATLERQVEAMEQKHAAASIIAGPDVRDEDTGLPFTDIIEELDDDDNVRSYRLQTPGNAQPQIIEALEKAGVKDLPAVNQQPHTEDPPVVEMENTPMDDTEVEHIEELLATNGTDDGSSSDLEQATVKKGVSFAEDTKPGHDEADVEQKRSRTAQRLVELMEKAKQQEFPSSEPVIPKGESAEDAELRREMLRYGISDIAPIVAELELEEDTEDSDDEGFDELDDSEDEDEHGRYKHSVLDEGYLQRMRELEKKLGIKSSRELDQEANGTKAPEEGIGRISVVQPPEEQSKSNIKSAPQPQSIDGMLQESQPVKKGVRFAEALDVAPKKKVEPFIDPMSNVIVERSSAAPPAARPATKKPSRFKKARAAGPVDDNIASNSTQLPSRPKGPADAPQRFLDWDIRTVPSGPDGKTLADTLVERETPSNAREPDEFDATLLHQEAASEYQRMRNRMIQKDGGYLKENTSAVVYQDEEESDARMSRFKAARLAMK